MAKTLSEKGIERLFQFQPNLILQVLGPVKYISGETSKLMKVTMSDGFAFSKDVVIPDDAREAVPGYQNSDFVNFVIKVKDSRSIGKQDRPIVLIADFQVVNSELQGKIGNPVSLDEFKKKGNKNSTSFIPTKKREASSSNSKFNKSNQNPVKVEKKSPNKKDSAGKIKQEPLQKQKEKPKQSKPIEAIHKKLSPQKSGPVHYTPIQELMIDQVGWTILARLTNKNEPRSFVGKKGPSSIMNIELMDKNKSTIQCVIFGDTATQLNDTLELNEVYEVSGGNVEMAKGPGGQPSSQIQIMLNQKSVFKFYKGKEAKSIPFIEDMTIKISRLIDQDADQDNGWNVIGMVKEQRKLEKLKTKAGKDMSKKVIVICDPDEKIQIPITLFFKLAQQKLSDQVHFFKNVFVGQYQSKKQFSMSFKSSIFPFPSYKFNNRRDIQDIEFTMGIQQSMPQKKLSCINKILMDQSKVTENSGGAFNSIRCYINNVKTNGTLWYMGCPSCKKKVFVDDAFKCTKCLKQFPKPKYYYILNMEVQDWHSSIWIVAYDEVARVLLQGFQADNAKDLDIEQFRDNHTKKLKNREIQCLVLSKGETYEGQWKVKHSMIKLLEIDYQEGAKESIKKIHEYLYA